jgi:hypothetical protein
MPLLIPCASQPLCPNYVERLGELCSTCRKQAEKQEKQKGKKTDVKTETKK